MTVMRLLACAVGLAVLTGCGAHQSSDRAAQPSLPQQSPYPSYTSEPTLTGVPTATQHPTYTPCPTYTPMPTYTPVTPSTLAPSATSLPTVTPSPTLVVEVPRDWLEYTDLVDGFTLRYPPYWSIVAQAKDVLILDGDTGAGCLVMLGENPGSPIGSPASIDALAMLAYGNDPSRIPEILDKGLWTSPVHANFALIEVYHTVSKYTSQSLWAQRSLDEKTAVVASVARYDGQISAEDTADLQTLLASIALLP